MSLSWSESQALKSLAESTARIAVAFERIADRFDNESKIGGTLDIANAARILGKALNPKGRA